MRVGGMLVAILLQMQGLPRNAMAEEEEQFKYAQETPCGFGGVWDRSATIHALR
jgi:hypothetical protein